MNKTVVARRLIHLAKVLLSETNEEEDGDTKAQCEDAKAKDEEEKKDEKSATMEESGTVEDWSPDDYSLEKTEKKKMNQNIKESGTFSDADTFEATVSLEADDTEKEASDEDSIAEALLGIAKELAKGE